MSAPGQRQQGHGKRLDGGRFNTADAKPGAPRVTRRSPWAATSPRDQTRHKPRQSRKVARYGARHRWPAVFCCAHHNLMLEIGLARKRADLARLRESRDHPE